MIADWLMPNFSDMSSIKRLASSDNRMLVSFFFMRYIVTHYRSTRKGY